MSLQRFEVTFGDQYRRDSHPTWPPAHPEGYAALWVPDEASAQQLAFRLFHSSWSFLYSPDHPDRPSVCTYYGRPVYTRGCLGRFVALDLDWFELDEIRTLLIDAQADTDPLDRDTLEYRARESVLSKLPESGS